MDLETGDPLDWTVDQVVAFLCHSSSTPWSQSANPARLPDSNAFEAAIRENMINGEVLLNDVDKETLREDLGLKALGPRSTVMAAIRYLRKLSVKYQRTYSAHTSTYNDGQHAYSPRLTPMTVASHMPGSPQHYPHVSRQVTPRQGILPASLPVAPSVPTAQEVKPELDLGDIPGPSLQLNGIHPSLEPPTSRQTGLDDHINNGPHGIPNLQPPQLPDERSVARSASPRLRPNEHFHVDGQGKKRRKLDFTSSALAQKEAVSDQEKPQSQAKNWYMGPSRFDPMDVFYPIQPDSEVEESLFVTLSPELPTAQRLFVKNCLHQLFRQQRVRLGTRDGYNRSAIFPCKSTLLGGNQPQFFTLYSSRDGKVTVTQETTADWPEFSLQSTQHPALGSKGRDPYDYLLEKYPVEENEEQALPLYGESGSEGEYDSDTWREIEESQEKPKYLTSHEVNSVIERCVRDYEEQWRRDHLPKQEHKAHRIWMEAKRLRNRNQQTKIIQRDIEHLQRRLQKIKKEIHMDKYAKIADLEFICQSMEQTVFNIEAQKWRISILDKPECPPKVPVISKPRLKKVRHDLDEESLDSESDDLADDSLSDFIEHDDDDAPMDISMTSSDSDDIISPSGERRKQRNSNSQVQHKSALVNAFDMSPSPPMPPATTQQQPPTSYVTLGGQDIEMIDLTSSRPDSPVDDFEITTPPLNPARPANEPESIPPLKMEQHSSPAISVIPPAPQSSDPGMARRTGIPLNRKKIEVFDIDVHDFKRMIHVKWSVLEDHRDRQRLLTKLIACLPADERTNMATAVPTYTRVELRSLTFRALQAMRNHSQKLRGLDASQNELIMRVASLYVSWNNCVRLNQKGINKSLLDNAINNKGDFEDFANQLSARLAAYTRMVAKEAKPARHDTSSTSTEDSDEELLAASSRTPHKKRKREIKESQEVKRNHEAAQVRVALQEEQRKRLEKKMESMGVSNDDPERQVVSFEHPVIYLDAHIGRRVKSHQLNGIQFMWRELIQDEKGEGCLLAHTMGLGKTMQV